MRKKSGYEDALKYSDKSIETEDRYDNEMTKSQVLVALNRKDDASAAEKKALAMASPLQVHIYARGLQAQKRADEAYAIFRDNAKKHPDMWFVHSGMARIYSSQGKFDDAAKEMKLALQSAPDNQKDYVDGLVQEIGVEAGHQSIGRFSRKGCRVDDDPAALIASTIHQG